MVGKVDYGMLWNILKCMNVKNKKDLIPLAVISTNVLAKFN